MFDFLSFNLIIYIIIFLILRSIFKADKYDRTHPFGLDKEKNKTLPSEVGENSGVTVYWGRYEDTDDIQKHLDKIQWLTNNSDRDVIWRRCMLISAGLSFVILFVLNPFFLIESQTFVMTIFICFIFIYFMIVYYKHHVIFRKTRHINRHIRELKKKLNISQINFLDRSDLIL